MGKLIVIEGACDGMGKSTQFSLLKDYLNENYTNVVTHHFPSYNTPQGKCVEMYLHGDFGDPSKLSPYFINGLYAMDRAVTWNTELKQTYDEDGIILLDRYTTSSLIYQSSFIEDIEKRKEFIDYVTDFEYNKLGIKEPDMVIFLNAPFDLVSRMRKERNQSTDIHEKDESLQRRFYNNALFIADYLNWTIINCAEDNKMKSIEEINSEIVDEVKRLQLIKR
jgi:dTMP kinase